MAKQVTVFVDNKPGRLEKVTNTLLKENINIRALTIVDRGDYGLIKLFVNNPECANLALSEAGFATALNEVLPIVLEDTPGKLHELIKLLSEHAINITNAFGFAKEAIFCIEAKDDDIKKITKLAHDHGFTLLSTEELYEL